MAAWLQYLITIETSPVLRFWTGQGDLTLSGNTYQGGGKALGVGELEVASGSPDRRMTITLSGIPTSLRTKFLQDVGAVKVSVAWIYSSDKGESWSLAPVSFSGRLSAPAMGEGTLTVEVETLRGDVDRGVPRFWSDEDQQRRTSGDKGMAYMKQLAKKGVETGWPP